MKNSHKPSEIIHKNERHYQETNIRLTGSCAETLFERTFCTIGKLTVSNFEIQITKNTVHLNSYKPAVKRTSMRNEEYYHKNSIKKVGINLEQMLLARHEILF